MIIKQRNKGNETKNDANDEEINRRKKKRHTHFSVSFVFSLL
jgi:hypothetical protein